MLSRNQMEQVIRGGGSVLHGGRLISKIEHLPTDADLALASGDTQQAGGVVRTLQGQMAALQAQIDQLQAGGIGAPGRVESGGASLDLGTRISGFMNAPGSQPLPVADLTDLVGPGPARAQAAGGYDTPDAIRAASDEDLTAIDGVGPATLKKLRETYPRGA